MTREAESPPGRRSALAAFFLSLVLPGLGHWYAGATTLAAIVAALFVAGVPLIVSLMVWAGASGLAVVVALATGWVVRLVAGLHAAWCARQRAEHRPAPSGAGYLRFVLLAGGLLLVASLFRIHYVVDVYRVPSQAGSPNLLEGDHFVAYKLTARDRAGQPGDLVVFPLPQDPTELFVKRVVAVGGDTVEFSPIDGTPTVNGRAFTRTPCPTTTASAPTRCFIEENLDGVRYRVWQTPTPATLPKFEVAAGARFVVGDNRGRSHDSTSELFGPVMADTLIGRVVARWLPFERAGSVLADEP